MTKRIVGKQRPFIEYYLQTWNGTESARLAGYKGNDQTLAAVGYENLRKPHIKAEIERRMVQMTISANEVLMRLAQQATGNIADFINDGGGINWSKVKQKGHLVKKVTHTKGKQSVIEIHDAQSALVHLGRHYGLFKEKLEISVIREVWETMEKLGLTIDDIKTDQLAHTLFATAGIEIANPKAAGTDSTE